MLSFGGSAGAACSVGGAEVAVRMEMRVDTTVVNEWTLTLSDLTGFENEEILSDSDGVLFFRQ